MGWASAALVGLAFGALGQEAAVPNHALNIPWGDQVVIGKGTARLDSPAHIREALTDWHESCRMSVVYWRLWDCGPAQVPADASRAPCFALEITADAGRAVVRVAAPAGLPVLTFDRQRDVCVPGPAAGMAALVFGGP